MVPRRAQLNDFNRTASRREVRVMPRLAALVNIRTGRDGRMRALYVATRTWTRRDEDAACRARFRRARERRDEMPPKFFDRHSDSCAWNAQSARLGGADEKEVVQRRRSTSEKSLRRSTVSARRVRLSGKST